MTKKPYQAPKVVGQFAVRLVTVDRDALKYPRWILPTGALEFYDEKMQARWISPAIELLHALKREPA